MQAQVQVTSGECQVPRSTPQVSLAVGAAWRAKASADRLVAEGRVLVNGVPAIAGVRLARGRRRHRLGFFASLKGGGAP